MRSPNIHVEKQTKPRIIDEGGYHPARVGETYKSGRYRALFRLGSGHFSTVWLCYNSANSSLSSSSPTSRGCVRALKIQKSASGYTDAAHDEIRILVLYHTAVTQSCMYILSCESGAD